MKTNIISTNDLCDPRDAMGVTIDRMDIVEMDAYVTKKRDLCDAYLTQRIVRGVLFGGLLFLICGMLFLRESWLNMTIVGMVTGGILAYVMSYENHVRALKWWSRVELRYLEELRLDTERTSAASIETSRIVLASSNQLLASLGSGNRNTSNGDDL